MAHTEQSLWTRFHRNGFVVIEKAIPAHILKALRREAHELKRIYAEHDPACLERGAGCIMGNPSPITPSPLFPAQMPFLLEPMGHLVQRRTAFSSVDRLSYVAARASLSEASSVVTHEFLFGSPIKNITNALFGTDARLVS